jgi:hypothetical protein
MQRSSVNVMHLRAARCRLSEATGATAFYFCLSSFLMAPGRSFRRTGPIGRGPGRCNESFRRMPLILSTTSALSAIYSRHA